MLRTKALYVAVAVLIGAGVAWAQHVTTESDPSANFAAFHTYYWEKTDPMPGNAIASERIMAEVDAAMARRGWTKAPQGQADLAVVANVATQASQRVDSFYTGFGAWGWGGWGPVTTVQTYLKGTLVVDLFDAKTKKLVWRGTAADTVSDDPRHNAEKISKAIQKMFGRDFLEDD